MDVTLTNICKEKGKLFAYFLEIAKLFVNDRLHQKLGVPSDGSDMYLHLKTYVTKTQNQKYETTISKCHILSKQQKDYLLPKNQEIDLENLDFSMCVYIMQLLGRKQDKELIKYMKGLRNTICHLSMYWLQRNMTQEEINRDIQRIKNNLEWHGIDMRLLNRLERHTYNLDS